MTEKHSWRVNIVDFGSRVRTGTVARRVRELGVYCELWAWGCDEAQIHDFNSGIILPAAGKHHRNSPRAHQNVF